MSGLLKFLNTIYLAPDGKFGSKKKHRWTGMIREIINLPLCRILTHFVDWRCNAWLTLDYRIAKNLRLFGYTFSSDMIRGCAPMKWVACCLTKFNIYQPFCHIVPFPRLYLGSVWYGKFVVTLFARKTERKTILNQSHNNCQWSLTVSNEGRKQKAIKSPKYGRLKY